MSINIRELSLSGIVEVTCDVPDCGNCSSRQIFKHEVSECHPHSVIEHVNKEFGKCSEGHSTKFEISLKPGAEPTSDLIGLNSGWQALCFVVCSGHSYGYKPADVKHEWAERNHSKGQEQINIPADPSHST